MEVDYNYQFIISTGLEEAMLNIGKGYIYWVTFSWDKSDTILMNFQVSRCFLANNIGSDYQVFKDFFLSFNLYKIFLYFFRSFLSH